MSNTHSGVLTTPIKAGDKIRETIQLKDSDWVGIRNNLIIVNRVQSYNSKHYTIIPSNNTQKEVIEKLQPQNIQPVDTSVIDTELKQLLNIDYLKKALIRHFNSLDRLRYLSDDDALLKRRRITKYKATINRYLQQLRQDTNFNLETLEKRISLCYSGKYVTARKVVVL